MMDVLFIQGAGSGAHDNWDDRLVVSLREALGDGYEVQYPRMPDESDPKFASWQRAIEKAIGALRSPAILVGHSVGGAVLINTLAKHGPILDLWAVVLIAAPFLGPGGWEGEDVPPLSTLGGRLPSEVPILLYHGDQDATVPITHLELYANALPHARIRRLAGRDHQLNNDLTEVANDLRELLGSRKTSSPARFG
jgi:predicted alpha/beta hydrolase family esterase